MGQLMLSGVGGSTNWLPFILPLVAILLAVKAGEMVAGYVKKRKLHQENELIRELDAKGDETV